MILPAVIGNMQDFKYLRHFGRGTGQSWSSVHASETQQGSPKRPSAG